MSKTIKVEYYKDDKLMDKKDLSWPQKYDDFIQDIIAKFSLKTKKSNIILQLITEDEDEVAVDSQDIINDYQEDNKINEFKFYLENKDDSDSEGEEPIDDIKDLKIEEELKLEEINIDNIIKDIFNKDEYEKKMKAEAKEYTDTFTSNLKQNIDNTLEEQKKSVEKDIDLILNNYSQLSINLQSDNNNKILNVQDDLAKIKDEVDSLSLGVDQLYDGINNNELVLSKVENLDKIISKKKKGVNNVNNNVNNNNNIQMSKIKNNNLQKGHNVNPLDDYMDEEEEDNKIKIKFEKKNIDKIIDIKDAKYININNIEFTNIGNKPLKLLKFIKDTQNSSDEINFFGNSKNTNELELTMDGELHPNKSQNTPISLNIKNAQPEQTYKMIIYVREKDKNKNISEPFEINIKINKAEDPNQQRIIIANQIYEEIKNEYPNHENLINKNEIINKLLNNNLNKDEINSKIQENDQKQNKNKAEEIYKELNINNINIDKKEVIDYIIEKNFDKEIVQKWINSKIEEQNKIKAEDIYNKLSQLNDVDFSKSNKDDIIKKIIELNFNEEEIKKAYIKKPVPVPVPEPVHDDAEKVNAIYNDLEEEYGISGFIDEDAAKDKIREYECDRERINKWIEEELINGGGDN